MMTMHAPPAPAVNSRTPASAELEMKSASVTSSDKQRRNPAPLDEQPPALPPFIVGPLSDTGELIDISRQVIGAIAQEIWKRSQGNDVLNWIEAERLYHKAMQQHGQAPPARPRKNARHGR